MLTRNTLLALLGPLIALVLRSTMGCGGAPPPSTPTKPRAPLETPLDSPNPFPPGYVSSAKADSIRKLLVDARHQPSELAQLADLASGLHVVHRARMHAAYTACDNEDLAHIDTLLAEDLGIYRLDENADLRCTQDYASCIALLGDGFATEFVFRSVAGQNRIALIVHLASTGAWPNSVEDEARAFATQNRRRCELERELRKPSATENLWTYAPGNKYRPIRHHHYCGASAKRQLSRLMRTLAKDESSSEEMWLPEHWYCDDDTTCHYSGSRQMIELGFSGTTTAEVSLYAIAPSVQHTEGYSYDALLELHGKQSQTPCSN